MELIIQPQEEKVLNTNRRYVISCTFMEGDADGYNTEKIEVNENDIEKYHAFIHAFACCKASYPYGMGGYDKYNGLPEYDAFFSNDEDFDEEDFDEEDFDEEDGTYTEEYLENVIKTLNPNEIFMNHPAGDEGTTTSFCGYKVEFIDERGSVFPVKIIFNEQELARIEECKKFTGNHRK